MLIKTTGRDVLQNKITYDGVFEHSFECEVLLPDYYPDIMRVVRVDAEQKLRDTTASGDRLTANGSAQLRILYMPAATDAEPTPALRCYTYTVPYEKVCDIKAAEGAHTTVTLRTQYLSCRILNPRKAAIKATVGICATVTAEDKVSIADAFDTVRPDIELASKMLTLSVPVAHAEKSFRMYEDLETEQMRPRVGEIISAEGSALLTEMKLIANKAVIKGDTHIKLLYMPADGTVPESVSYVIPFSQMLDIDGIDDGDTCLVNFTVADIIAKPVEDQTSDGRLVSAEILIRADASAFATENIEYAADAFSTEHDSAVMMRTCDTELLTETVSERTSVNERVELGIPDMMGIIDVSASAYIKNIASSDGGITVSGNIEMSVLALTNSGDIENSDRSVPFTAVLPYECDRAELHTAIEEMSYSSTGDTADMRFTLATYGALFKRDRTQMLTSVDIDDTKPRETPSAVLTVYYPEKGETVWEIAKRYGVAPAVIRRTNKLEGDSITAKTVMISRRKASV